MERIVKIGIFALVVSIGLTGCYTRIYAPPEFYAINSGTVDSLSVPDSIVSGGVTIYNQNQIIVDQYYQDPYYYRGWNGGRYGYWDPYYYNPYGYHRPRHWWKRHYGGGGSTPGTPTPTPPTPRREKDYRRSGSTSDAPLPISPSMLQPGAPSVPVTPGKPAEDPNSGKTDPPKLEEPTRELRSTEPVKAEPEKPVPPPPAPPEEKQERREKSRER